MTSHLTVRIILLMSRLTATREESELTADPMLEVRSAACEAILCWTDEAAAARLDSWLAKEAESEAASPVAVARTELSDSNAAEYEASAAEAEEARLASAADADEAILLQRYRISTGVNINGLGSGKQTHDSSTSEALLLALEAADETAEARDEAAVEGDASKTDVDSA